MAKNNQKCIILDLPTFYIYNKQLFLPTSQSAYPLH